MTLYLLPIVDHIGDTAIEHGERGADLDPYHPEACLCGRYLDYLACPDPGIAQLTIYPAKR